MDINIGQISNKNLSKASINKNLRNVIELDNKNTCFLAGTWDDSFVHFSIVSTTKQYLRVENLRSFTLTMNLKKHILVYAL